VLLRVGLSVTHVARHVYERVVEERRSPWLDDRLHAVEQVGKLLHLPLFDGQRAGDLLWLLIVVRIVVVMAAIEPEKIEDPVAATEAHHQGGDARDVASQTK